MSVEQNKHLTRGAEGIAGGPGADRRHRPALVDDLSRVKNAERLRWDQDQDKNDFDRREYFRRI